MIQIDAAPAGHKIAEPLEHLASCHRRIEQKLDTLERIGAALDENPTAALAALDSTLRFFDTTGRLHTRDEEESVFPRLRPQLDAADLNSVDALEHQHRETDLVYEQLKQSSVDLRADLTPDRIARYRALADRLIGLYREHIAAEEGLVLPLGRRVLRPEQLADIQQEMRDRRSS